LLLASTQWTLARGFMIPHVYNRPYTQITASHTQSLVVAIVSTLTGTSSTANSHQSDCSWPRARHIRIRWLTNATDCSYESAKDFFNCGSQHGSQRIFLVRMTGQSSAYAWK